MSTKVVTQTKAISQQKSSARIQWNLEAPEYALLLVITFIIWTFGFIELLNHTSTKPTILGLYSTGFFINLVVYSGGFLVLAGLLAKPKRSGWLTHSATFIQSRPLVALATLSILALLIWGLFTLDPLTASGPFRQLGNLPVVRFTFASLITLTGGLIIFAGWGQQKQVGIWRKALAGIIAIALGVELIAQGVAYYGIVPGSQKIDGSLVPFGRVYQNQEGFSHGTTNNYGWYYPNFRLRKNTKKILILGDSFIQALQIDPAQHLGVQLENYLNEGQDGEIETEVLAMGMPGFGPGLYLSETRLQDTIDKFNPDEVIVFFHLSNDFQIATEPSENHLIHLVDETGAVTLHPETENYIHSLKHYIVPGYVAAIDPLLTIKSHILTPKLIQQFVSGQPATKTLSRDEFDVPRIEGVITDQKPITPKFSNIKATSLVETPGAANFLFEKTMNDEAQNAVAIIDGILKAAQEQLNTHDITLRVVTIPAFSPAFYAQPQANAWTPEIGAYDLFLPERALQSFANENGIPFLPMGQYMHENTSSVSEIQDLFFLDGLGHFTPEGHTYFANALYACFYGGQVSGAEALHCLDN